MKKKIIKKCIKSLINLNETLEKENNNLISEINSIGQEQNGYFSRIQIIKNFLTYKKYSDGDFKEYLNQKLADKTSNLELKEQIKKYFNVLSITNNLKG